MHPGRLNFILEFNKIKLGQNIRFSEQKMLFNLNPCQIRKTRERKSQHCKENQREQYIVGNVSIRCTLRRKQN